jgi:large conductance mechanosensitive channel
MIKGFKEFILRGNVIDLAVAFVIGVAFSAIVSTIVTSIINPLIGVLFNASTLNEALPVRIPAIAGGTPAVIYFGALIAAVINFLLIAVVVYFALVVPINFLKKRAFQKKESDVAAVDEDTPPTELELLTDIRNLLASSEATRSGSEPAIGRGQHAGDLPTAQ